VQPDVFPRDALDANRAGRLTPDQAALFRTEASSDRRNLLFAGLAIVAFGALIVFGTLAGRIPGGRLEPLLVGAAMIAFGIILAFFGGVRGSRTKAAAADAGRVTSLDGPFRRERVDRSAGLFGDDSSHVSPGNEYDYLLFVGDRRFSVGEAQWAAAPEDGIVRVYLLGDSDRIVNLERTADAPPAQIPGFVRHALEQAAASPDAARAAQARAMLAQADAHTGATPVSTVSAGEATPGAGTVPLEQAILGTWRSDLAGITYEFRPDGSVTASAARRDAGEQRWSVAGPDAVRLGDATVPAAVVGDVLTLGRPPQALTFHRVAP
jgi:hypothetical protein